MNLVTITTEQLESYEHFKVALGAMWDIYEPWGDRYDKKRKTPVIGFICTDGACTIHLMRMSYNWDKVDKLVELITNNLKLHKVRYNVTEVSLWKWANS